MGKGQFKNMRIMTIFGTRPEAIKMAPLIRELKNRDSIEVIVCVTAQHREMLDQVLKIFDIEPDYDLNIMKANQTLTQITCRIIQGMEDIIKQTKPDLILVHGDTSTTFAGALVAFYHNVKIGHIEAGLRTYEKYSPFPEEMNRQMVSRLADYHFAPTQLACDNLLKEGIDIKKIYITGNTAIDALATTVKENYEQPILNWVGDSKLILMTAHRRENLGEPMKHIFKAIKKIVTTHDDVKVVYPVHMNPHIRALANDMLSDINRIKMIEPLDVTDFHNLINKSYLILTDSGGIQEEAPSLGKPVLVLRDSTERPEGVSAGTLRLVGTDENKIFDLVDNLLSDPIAYAEMANAINPYGDGKASSKIADAISANYIE